MNHISLKRQSKETAWCISIITFILYPLTLCLSVSLCLSLSLSLSLSVSLCLSQCKISMQENIFGYTLIISNGRSRFVKIFRFLPCYVCQFFSLLVIVNLFDFSHLALESFQDYMILGLFNNLLNIYHGHFIVKIVKEFKKQSSKCSVKMVFLEILQNQQENTCARVSVLITLQA